MTTATTLSASYPIRYYTVSDPYFYTIENLMVASAEARDVYLAGQIDTKISNTGLTISEVANGKQGVTTLVGGSKVVANTNITANSRIFLTSQQDGGVPGFLRVSTRTPGTSFTITSSNLADTSVVAYLISEPA